MSSTIDIFIIILYIVFIVSTGLSVIFYLVLYPLQCINPSRFPYVCKCYRNSAA